MLSYYSQYGDTSTDGLMHLEQPLSPVRRQGTRRKHSLIDDSVIPVAHPAIIDTERTEQHSPSGTPVAVNSAVDGDGRIHTAISTPSVSPNITPAKKQRLLHNNTANDISNLLDGVHINHTQTADKVSAVRSLPSPTKQRTFALMYTPSVVNAMKSVHIDVYSNDASHLHILALLCYLHTSRAQQQQLATSVQPTCSRDHVMAITHWLHDLTPHLMHEQLAQYNCTNAAQLSQLLTQCLTLYTKLLDAELKRLYIFSFVLARQHRTTLDTNIACELIRLFLHSHTPTISSLILMFLQIQQRRQPGLRMTLDQYTGVYEFCVNVTLDQHTQQLDGYDSNDSWPVLIDDFVDWLVQAGYVAADNTKYHLHSPHQAPTVSRQTSHSRLRIDTHAATQIDHLQNKHKQTLLVHRSVVSPTESDVLPLDDDDDDDVGVMNQISHVPFVSDSSDSDDDYGFYRGHRH